MNRRDFLLGTGAAALTGAARGKAPREMCNDFADVAFHFAGKAAPMLTEKIPTNGRVAVFAPGDGEGKMTVDIHEASRTLQGELIYHLTNLAKDRFFILDKAALARAFARGGVAPQSLDRSNPRATAAVLHKLDLDAAIFGTIDAVKNRVGDGRLVPASLAVMFKDGATRQLTEHTWAWKVPPVTSNLYHRLRVEFWLTPAGGTPQRVPLVTDDRPGTEQHGVVYAALPDGVAAGRDGGATYAIRLVSTGEVREYNKTHPEELPVQKARMLERLRLFTVALAVDGVNSIYQNTGAGRVGPVMVDPRNATRWVVAPRFHRLVRTGPAPTDYAVRSDLRANFEGLEVRGFQSSGDTALAFTLAPPAESIAEAVGVTEEVGVIRVGVRRQQLPGDTTNPVDLPPPVPPTDKPIRAGSGTSAETGVGEPLGTKAGAPVRNAVAAMKVDTYDEPEFVARILYRRDRDVPIPPPHRVDPWTLAK